MASGLLPRSNPQIGGPGSTGFFDSLEVGTLVVDGTAAIKNLSVSGSETFSNLAADSIVITTSTSALSALTLTNGQLVIGSTGALPVAATLTAGFGINITNGAGSITIAIGAETPKSAVITDAGGNLSTLTLTNGQLVVGSTGNVPVAAALTAGTGVTVGNAPGAITISIGQSVATSATPQFAGLNIGSQTEAASAIVNIAGTDGSFMAGPATAWYTSADQYPLFERVPLSHNSLFEFWDCYLDSSGTIRSSSALGNFGIEKSNGLLLFLSDTGKAQGAATSLPTSLMQLSASSGIVTIGSLALTNTTVNGFAYIGASKALLSTAAATNGQLLIGSTGSVPVAATLTAGSGITVTNGAGTITIATSGGGGTVTSISAGTGITCTPNPITGTGSVALTVPVAISSGGTGLTSTPTDGQLLIGSTGSSNYGLATLAAGTGVTVTNASHSITVAIGQSVATSATPTFASETLSAVTNQLTLGTTKTTTLTSPAPGTSQTITIPDQSSNLGTASTAVLTTNTTTYMKTGTYTPTMGDGSNNFTATVHGYYAIIGDVTVWSAYINWTSKGSATAGSVVVISLPSTTTAGGGFYYAPATIAFASNITFTNNLFAGTQGGAQGSVSLQYLTSGGTYTQITVANCAGNGLIILGGEYRTA
jgi:hypothetical protein